MAQGILNSKSANKIQLPIDHIAAPTPDDDGQSINGHNIPPELMGLDIGPQSIESYKSTLRGAKTVLWNGPMGMF